MSALHRRRRSGSDEGSIPVTAGQVDTAITEDASHLVRKEDAYLPFLQCLAFVEQTACGRHYERSVQLTEIEILGQNLCDFRFTMMFTVLSVDALLPGQCGIIGTQRGHRRDVVGVQGPL